MALSTYGPALDLHAGGADLRFPHHAYEAAQAEAATGVTPFARSWLHVGTVKLAGEKSMLLEPFRFGRFAKGELHPTSHSPFPWS